MHLRSLARLLPLLLLLLPPALSAAVPGLDYYLPSDHDPDPAIPTPKAVLGADFADYHLHHHEVIHYLQALDTASDRVQIREYAHSHGRRPLISLTLTSPENHARLEDIRQAHLARLAAPDLPKDATSNAPVIVWMGYGIHGNEPSATHAGVLLAYHLASARDAFTVNLLKNTVILLDPCLNPDGFERFSSWTNAHRGRYPRAHRADREHQEGWPSGRSNYYGFDLNRDWLPAVHPESQGRLKLFHQWQPHIVTDYHEMGNVNRTYFFQPGIAAMVHPLTPKQNQVLTAKMAREHARALDAIGSLYYTGESYDDYYIGKGSTYPDVNGSVGVLFEQASSRGFHQDTEHGRLTFPFTIRNQFTTSLSTLRSAAALRADFITYQHTFFREALAEAATAKTQAHLVTCPTDPSRLAAFRDLLRLHQIQSHTPAADVTHEGRTHTAGHCLVIPVQQRQFRLLSALFETRTRFASSTFYDVSAWHLPSAYGLTHVELPTVPAAAPQTPPKPIAGISGPAAKAYAYLFSWEPREAPRALFHLQAHGVRTWTSTRPFSITTAGSRQTFPRGSIVIPVSIQDKLPAPALQRLLTHLARENHLPITAVTTGYRGSVPDLGSPTFQPLSEVKPLLLVGSGVGSTSAGEVWHQFDQVWHHPLTQVEALQLTATVLRDHTHLILTDAPLPTSARAAIHQWVAQGGTLIAIGSSARSLAEQDWCKVELAKATHTDSPPPAPTDKSQPAKAGSTPAQLPFDQAGERRTARELNGVILRATFDPAHPLTFGLGSGPHLHLMRDGTTFLKPSSSPYLNPLQYTATPLVSGSASTANLDALKLTTPLQVKPVDSGRVILMTDNPVFRGHWLGTEKLLANALFFAHLVKATGGE